MDKDDKKLFNVSAMCLNTISMMMYLLTALITMSVGLAFYFLVASKVGYGIGIAMFVISAIIFIMGELMFFANMGKIKMHDNM